MPLTHQCSAFGKLSSLTSYGLARDTAAMMVLYRRESPQSDAQQVQAPIQVSTSHESGFVPLPRAHLSSSAAVPLAGVISSISAAPAGGCCCPAGAFRPAAEGTFSCASSALWRALRSPGALLLPASPSAPGSAGARLHASLGPSDQLCTSLSAQSAHRHLADVAARPSVYNRAPCALKPACSPQACNAGSGLPLTCLRQDISCSCMRKTHSILWLPLEGRPQTQVCTWRH